MDESASAEPADAPAAPYPDANALIASLRAAGAHRFDPVALHYIDVLAHRITMHQGDVQRVLDAKLAQALATLAGRLGHARAAARQTLERTAAHHAHAADALQQLFDAGDFKELERFAKTLTAGEESASLAALVRQLVHHVPQTPRAMVMENPGRRIELKTLRDSRNTWSKLSADKQVTRALQHAPKNAGPINSHILMLRSLELMRDVAPDYLNRFMSYADTLLRLDQSDDEKPGAAKKTVGTAAAKQKSKR